MTGIRLWMSSISALGAVVMMVQVRRVAPSGERQDSHRPAKTKGFPDLRRMYIGVLPLTPGSCRHS